MEVPYRNEPKAPGPPLLGNNEEFLTLMESRDMGSNERGPQLHWMPRLKEPFKPAFLTALGFTLVFLSAVYLLLSCFQYLSFRYGAGHAARGLAQGGSPKGTPCQADSDEEQDSPGETGEHGGPIGNRGPPRGSQTSTTPQTGHQQGGFAAPPPAAAGGAGAVSGSGSSLGARPKTKSWPTEQPEEKQRDEGWGLRQMPVRTQVILQHYLSSMARTAKTCREIAPLLGPQDGGEFVRLMSILAAIQLSAFSIGPLEQEPTRQAAAAEYIALVDNAVEALKGLEEGEAQRLRLDLEGLSKTIRAMQKIRPIQRPISAQSYSVKILTAFKIFSAEGAHVSEVLRRLSMLSTRTLSRTEILQQLNTLSAIVEIRRRQIARDGFMRWWALKCQNEVREWLVIRPQDIHPEDTSTPFMPLEDTINEIDQAVVGAWGAMAPPRPFSGVHGQGQSAPDDDQQAQQMKEGKRRQDEPSGSDAFWEYWVASEPGQGIPHDIGPDQGTTGPLLPGSLVTAPSRGSHLPGMSHEFATRLQEHKVKDATGGAPQSEGAVGAAWQGPSTVSEHGEMQVVDFQTRVLFSFSQLTDALGCVRYLLPAVDRRNGLRLARLVASLVALELGAFSSIPAGLQSERYEVARRCRGLLREILARDETSPEDDPVYEDLESLASILGIIKKEPKTMPEVTQYQYEKWMVTQAQACQVSSHHLVAILHSMMHWDTRRADPSAFIQQQLGYLEALVRTRTEQILATGISRYWLVKAQEAAKKWVLFSKSQLKEAEMIRRPTPLPGLIVEMDLTLAHATGTAALARHAGQPLRQQAEVQATPVTPQSSAGAVRRFGSSHQMEASSTATIPQQRGPVAPSWPRTGLSPHSTPRVPQYLGPGDPDTTQRHPRAYDLPFGSQMPSPDQGPPAPVRPYTLGSQRTPTVPGLPLQYPHDDEAIWAPLDQGPHTSQSAARSIFPPYSGPPVGKHAGYQAQDAAGRHATGATRDTGDIPLGDDEQEDEDSLDPTLLRLLEKGLRWEEVPDIVEDDQGPK